GALCVSEDYDLLQTGLEAGIPWHLRGSFEWIGRVGGRDTRETVLGHAYFTVHPPGSPEFGSLSVYRYQGNSAAALEEPRSNGTVRTPKPTQSLSRPPKRGRKTPSVVRVFAFHEAVPDAETAQK